MTVCTSLKDLCALAKHCRDGPKATKIEKAFVDAGFVDRVTKTCPDIYQMMSMCGTDFDKNRLRREAFIDNLETVIAEHVRRGYVSEEFFDTLGVAVDMDAHGREYPLTLPLISEAGPDNSVPKPKYNKNVLS
jgi:hypothetical protein